MSRGFLIAPPTIAFLLAFTPVSMAQKGPPDPTATNLNSSRSNIYRQRDTTPAKKASRKHISGGIKGGGPAGIAVSDPGAEGTKPAKKSSK